MPYFRYLRFPTACDHVDRLELEHVVSSARLQSESVRAMLHCYLNSEHHFFPASLGWLRSIQWN